MSESVVIPYRAHSLVVFVIALKGGEHIMKDYIPEGFVFAAGAFLQYQLTFLPVRTDIFHDLTFILLCGLRMFLFSLVISYIIF